jgi:hypothetical protein
VHLLDRLDEPLDLLNQRACCGPDGFDNAPIVLLDGHRRKGLFFLQWHRRCRIRLTESAFAGARRFSRFPGQSLGWEARGDILGALDLVSVAVLIHLLWHWGASHRVRPSLNGIAVGVLLSMSQPASWAEAHAAPSPGKISVTHI